MTIVSRDFDEFYRAEMPRLVVPTGCDAVALRLNTRPRKTLEWKTPGQVLNKRLAATAV